LHDEPRANQIKSRYAEYIAPLYFTEKIADLYLRVKFRARAKRCSADARTVYQNSSQGADCDVQSPECEGAHPFIKAAEPSAEAIENEQAHESKTHHGSIYSRGRSA
jgi:hypothetical protein